MTEAGIGAILGYIIGRTVDGKEIEIPIKPFEPIEDFDVLFYSTNVPKLTSKEIAKIETQTSNNTRILYFGHCWHPNTVWTLDTKGRPSIQWQTQLGTPASLFQLNYQVPEVLKVVIVNNDGSDHIYTIVLVVSKGYTKASGFNDASFCTETLLQNVNITSPATITIQGSGTNIIIDKLTQGAVLPRLSFNLSICGDYSQAPFGYARSQSGYGFYLPRGMRCVLRTISVKVRNTHASSAQNIVGRLSAFISGYRYDFSQTVSVPANTATEVIFWNVLWTPKFSFWQYDALFFFIDLPASGANIEVGFDNTTFLGATIWSSETPPTSPAAWIFDDLPSYKGGGRNIVAVINVHGNSIGDLPVSGTVNNIQIPNTAVTVVNTVTSCATGVWTTLTTIDGAGKLLNFKAVAPTISDFVYRITADDVVVPIVASAPTESISPAHMSLYGWGNATPMCSLCKYTAGSVSAIYCTLPIPFQKSIKFEAFQASGASKDLSWHVACEKLV